MKSKVNVFLLFLCITLCLPANMVFAASGSPSSDPYCLNKTNLKLQIGNYYHLYLINSNQAENPYSYDYYYDCVWTSSDDEVALVEHGKITIVGKGKAVITATYNGKKYTCKIMATASSYHLTKYDITTKTFTEEYLRMTHTDQVDYYSYDVYRIEDGKEVKCSNAFEVDIDSETGNIQLKALQGGNYRIDFYANTYDEEATYETQTYKASCNVTVTVHGLIEKEIGCALNTQRKLTFSDLSQITFQVNDPSIASINEQGMITPLSIGETCVKMTGYNEMNEMEEYNCALYVTNPCVTLEKNYVNLNNYVCFDITGSSYYSETEYKSSNEAVICASDYELLAVKEGKASIAVIVDGRKFSFKVEVVNPRMKKDSFLLSKNEKTNITLLGLNHALKSEDVTYTIGNTKVAMVSNTGKITAKSGGNTLLTVKLADYTFTASISVGNSKSLQAIKNASKALGATYSQEKRMQKGYYDCSSLIWRSYTPTGITFGDNHYAPTAAGIAKYLYDHKKVISYEFIDPRKLLPGDLIFYSGENNGRFKNINHVSIFTGIVPGGYYSPSTEKFYPFEGQIIHASSGSVIQSNLTESYGSIAMIARPTK